MTAEFEMSETEHKQFAERLDTMSKLANLIKILLALSFAFGSWIATLEYRHRSTESSTLENKRTLHDVSLWRERTEASRFDAKQGNDLQVAFSNRANMQDLRVQKLESGQEEIRKSLARIESKLGTK